MTTIIQQRDSPENPEITKKNKIEVLESKSSITELKNVEQKRLSELGGEPVEIVQSREHRTGPVLV